MQMGQKFSRGMLARLSALMGSSARSNAVIRCRT
jgi:hypothetical protein